MIYDRHYDVVYINSDEIWSVLEDKFGLEFFERQKIIGIWLGEVYNLRGVRIYANGEQVVGKIE